jgi:predicted RecB family nuclease
VERLNGQPVYSATDLVGFLACEHLTNLERAAMAGLVQRPLLPDPELDRIAKRGDQHEQRFLTELEAQSLDVVKIATDGSAGTRYEQLVQAASETLDAMRKAVDVIYQATFFDGQWRGHADFLRKVDTPSAFGPWSYEVWDTKLARQTKGSAILQLCMYTDLLTSVQGTQPEYMYVALGGSAREVQKHRFTDYAAYYRLMRAEFLRAVSAGDAAYPPSTLPDPVEHCDICRWSQQCRAQRRETDDLSLVAGITARQRKVLRERGVETRMALGALPLPMTIDPPVKLSARPSLARVREQARVQVEGEQAGKVIHELIDPPVRDGVFEANRGLLMLPPPSPGDL